VNPCINSGAILQMGSATPVEEVSGTGLIYLFFQILNSLKIKLLSYRQFQKRIVFIQMDGEKHSGSKAVRLS
jgi:hypothetical protein